MEFQNLRLEEKLLTQQKQIVDLKRERLKDKTEIRDLRAAISKLYNKKKQLYVVPGAAPGGVPSFYCRICDTECSSQKQLDEHLGGERHERHKRNMACKHGKKCSKRSCKYVH